MHTYNLYVCVDYSGITKDSVIISPWEVWVLVWERLHGSNDPWVEYWKLEICWPYVYRIYQAEQTIWQNGFRLT